MVVVVIMNTIIKYIFAEISRKIFYGMCIPHLAKKKHFSLIRMCSETRFIVIQASIHCFLIKKSKQIVFTNSLKTTLLRCLHKPFTIIVPLFNVLNKNCECFTFKQLQLLHKPFQFFFSLFANFLLLLQLKNKNSI